ncbi:Nucleotide-binding universal stress protein, UspA family [Marinobacter daqiaonensis]|uniref:Nucleotide-binding universal stress protein, UspA family n=1 Tax=Marinobacter daqiaonensis TaxID=650891 RepID=A0A1I6GGY4_9GAMM|nr:universal stress protein [Marinobacter daqiaonensis]SFR41444.1 Nucleotide-binding universal stress protein, UspA family [Marinobacter daqiaonensis]
MLSHMILSVDYSDGWEQAVKQLPALLIRLQVRKLTLTYVIETHRRRHVEDSDEAVERKLKDMARQLAEEWEVETDFELRHGFVASRIVELARHHEADGIICCNTHHSAGRELFMGNNAMNLARMTRLPLLVLPVDGRPSFTQSPVYLATDGSDCAERASALFHKLVEDGTEGRVIWVRPEDAPSEADKVDEMVHTIANRKVNVHATIPRGRPAQELLHLIQEGQPALTLIGKRGTTPITEIALGHTAETVVRESHQPVLLMP